MECRVCQNLQILEVVSISIVIHGILQITMVFLHITMVFTNNHTHNHVFFTNNHG